MCKNFYNKNKYIFIIFINIFQNNLKMIIICSQEKYPRLIFYFTTDCKININKKINFTFN